MELIDRQQVIDLAMQYCPDDDGSVLRDVDIRELLDDIENLPSAQPEEAIPVLWIEAIIERFMMSGDAFSGLTASIIRVMLNEWKKEQEGDTK